MPVHGLALAAALVLGVPLPRGSRPLDPAHPDALVYVSGKGFRDTVGHVRRHLRRHAIAHDAVPVYRRRGVTLARFLSRPPAPWLAIHVFQLDGRTLLAIVPAAPPRSPPPP